jgi:hypothetical protein
MKFPFCAVELILCHNLMVMNLPPPSKFIVKHSMGKLTSKVQTFFCSYIIKPGTYYFLPSLNLSALSFKREEAKEASFLEVKLFTRQHISKWVRNNMYLA